MAAKLNMSLDGRGRKTDTEKGIRKGCVQGMVGCFGKLRITIGDPRAPKADVPGSSSLAPRTTLEFSSIAAAAVTFLRSL